MSGIQASRFADPPHSAACIGSSERQSLLRFRLSNAASMTPLQVELTGLPQKPTRHLSGGNKTGSATLHRKQTASAAIILPQIHHIGTVTLNRRLFRTCSFTQTQPRSHTIGLLCCCLRTKEKNTTAGGETCAKHVCGLSTVDYYFYQNLYPEEYNLKYAGAAPITATSTLQSGLAKAAC